MVTKTDLQDELNSLGVWYPRKATKADLEALLAEANPTTSAAVPDDVYIGDAIVADDPRPLTVGPTGLCLQCNKPADHKHVGV